MDIKKLYGTNKEKETAGVWIELLQGVKVKVKRAGSCNKDFSFAMSRALKPYNRQLQMGVVDPAKLREININLYATHIVTDWQGIEIEGKVIPFSKEKFVEISTMLPEFFDDVCLAATEIANFQEAEQEELVKKPANSTATA